MLPLIRRDLIEVERAGPIDTASEVERGLLLALGLRSREGGSGDERAAVLEASSGEALRLEVDEVVGRAWSQLSVSKVIELSLLVTTRTAAAYAEAATVLVRIGRVSLANSLAQVPLTLVGGIDERELRAAVLRVLALLDLKGNRTYQANAWLEEAAEMSTGPTVSHDLLDATLLRQLDALAVSDELLPEALWKAQKAGWTNLAQAAAMVEASGPWLAGRTDPPAD